MEDLQSWSSRRFYVGSAAVGQYGLRDFIDVLVRAGFLQAEPAFDRDDYRWSGTLRITNAVSALRSLLGVSLTDIVARQNGPRGTLVFPHFGPPIDNGEYEFDVFVLMPFAEGMAAVYSDNIRAVAERMRLTVARADDFFTTKEIMVEVWSAIANARVLIADCTGKNPNVFYEIGIAHTLGKPVILVTQNADDVPFDLRHRRYIQYNVRTARGMKQFQLVLEQTLRAALAEPEEEDAEDAEADS